MDETRILCILKMALLLVTGLPYEALAKYGGESEIRTHDPIKDNGFQDRRNRPLCHLSPNLCCFYFTRTYGWRKPNETLAMTRLSEVPLVKYGAPRRSRTYNLQIRSLTLYPIELRAPYFYSTVYFNFSYHLMWELPFISKGNEWWRGRDSNS